MNKLKFNCSKIGLMLIIVGLINIPTPVKGENISQLDVIDAHCGCEGEITLIIDYLHVCCIAQYLNSDCEISICRIENVNINIACNAPAVSHTINVSALVSGTYYLVALDDNNEEISNLLPFIKQ